MSVSDRQPYIRYWIEFGHAPGGEVGVPVPARVCGVTADSLDDALLLVAASLFRGQSMPPVERVIVDVDLAMLDAFHVGPSVLPPQVRGIWYPPLGTGAR